MTEKDLENYRIGDGYDEYKVYAQGCKDAAEYYRLIVCQSGLTHDELEEIFGMGGSVCGIIENYDFDEIKSKIDKYREKSIEVGDEVRILSRRTYIVTNVDGGKLTLIAPTGLFAVVDKNTVIKTGRKFPIQKILSALQLKMD